MLIDIVDVVAEIGLTIGLVATGVAVERKVSEAETWSEAFTLGLYKPKQEIQLPKQTIPVPPSNDEMENLTRVLSLLRDWKSGKTNPNFNVKDLEFLRWGIKYCSEHKGECENFLKDIEEIQKKEDNKEPTGEIPIEEVKTKKGEKKTYEHK